ncbi:hypothetical protein JCM19297_1275 [Nonlabens ulvanivorans]|nr:hypothetical protein JCM19297_1275 [Nonlabens ulvanivorans]
MPWYKNTKLTVVSCKFYVVIPLSRKREKIISFMKSTELITRR